MWICPTSVASQAHFVHEAARTQPDSVLWTHQLGDGTMAWRTQCERGRVGSGRVGGLIDAH